MKIGIVSFVKKFFYLFLDISGSLLGILLIFFGTRIIKGYLASVFMGWILTIVGISALAIHLSHYLVARKYGSEYFRTTRKNLDK